MKRITTMAFLAVLLLALPSARADVMTYSISVPNGSALAAYQGPYATLTVNLTDATHATITFNAATVTQGNDTWYYLMNGSSGGQGNNSMVGVNINAASFTYDMLSGNSPQANATVSLSFAGLGGVDGLGDYNLRVNNSTNQAGSSLDTVSFRVINQSGTWLNAAAVLTTDPFNNQNYRAAVHVYVFDNAAYTPPAVLTAFSAAGPPTGQILGVPEPTSLMAWSVLGLAGVFYRRRRKA